MKTMIVEKVQIDLKTGKRQEVFALASSEKNTVTHKYSLTYEGYISDWSADRKAVESLQLAAA